MDNARYSVEVEQAAQRVKSRKGSKRCTFRLKEDVDGWETIQEAQNAVATLAIHEVVAAKDH